MNRKQVLIVAGAAIMAVLALIITYVLVGQPATTTALPQPTVVTQSAMPTPSATVTPSATPTAPATTTAKPSVTPTTSSPKPSQTADDPTTEWDDPVDCPPGDPEIYTHLGQCKVKGKSTLQVVKACRSAANGWMAFISNGEAGDSAAIDTMSDDAETCLAGSGFYTGASYDGLVNVEGCPEGCKKLSSRDGLQYILLTGGMKWKGEFQEQSLLFNAKTGMVMDDSEAKRQTNIWLSQFGD